MKVTRNNRSTTIRFDHPFESLTYLARQNENWFCDEAAIKLYRQALGHARNDDERALCEGKMAFLRSELKAPTREKVLIYKSKSPAAVAPRTASDKARVKATRGLPSGTQTATRHKPKQRAGLPGKGE